MLEFFVAQVAARIFSDLFGFVIEHNLSLEVKEFLMVKWNLKKVLWRYFKKASVDVESVVKQQS